MFGKRNYFRPQSARHPTLETDNGASSDRISRWKEKLARPNGKAAPNVETEATEDRTETASDTRRSSSESNSSQDTIEIPRGSGVSRSADPEFKAVADMLEVLLWPQKRPDLSHLTTERSIFSSNGLGPFGDKKGERGGSPSRNLSDLVKSIVDERGSEQKKRYNVHAKWTPLHASASRGKLAQVTVLLEKGADVDAREDDGWSPLMLAAQNGYLEVVRTLINHHANVNHTGDEGVTALRQAAQGGHVEIVELLLSHNADPNKTAYDGTTALFAAVAGTMRPGKNKANMTRIAIALIRAGARTDTRDSDGDTPLAIACIAGEIELARQLLAAGADINTSNQKGNSCLGVAAYHANAAMVKFLLENRAKVDHRGTTDWTPLHLCVQFLRDETFEVVKLLIEAGANVNARTNDNATPLHIAVQKGDPDIVQYLIKKGANINAKTMSGRTPLFQAACNDHLDIVELLIKSGGDVNVTTDEESLTILHVAIILKNVVMVEKLLKLGANPNAKARGTTTPLSLASDGDDDKIFFLLIEHGADIS